MKKFILTAVLLSIAYAFSADIIWRKYKEIQNDVFISSTDNLIIEAGTTVRFAPHASLTVYGQISSNGTETDPVILAPLYRDSLRWNGIKINSMSGINTFTYTHFNFLNPPVGSGDGGLTIFKSNATIANCRFKSCSGESGGAVKITSGNVTLQNTAFFFNSAQNGGAVYILNQTETSSQVNINACLFERNTAWSNGGAIHIIDDPSSPNIMNLYINKCLMRDNKGNGLGGAVFYQNEGRIDADFTKSRIMCNKADWGSGIYARFQPFVPGSIPPQLFSNLLVFKNGGWSQSGVYIDMGQSVNPFNLKFTNTTIAFNCLIDSFKVERDNTSGIYMRSSGNYTMIENTTIWGNTDKVGISSFWIDDNTNPLKNNIFKFCDIQNYYEGGTNINADPIFIRPPLSSLFEVFDPDRYDFHEVLNSPIVNMGDPALTDPDGTRLNIGAYGGTAEATKASHSTVVATTNSDVSVSDYSAVVLDFQGKSGKFVFNNLNLGQNAQLFLKSAYDADIQAINFTTPLSTQSDFEGYVSIQALRDANTGSITPVQGLTVSDIANISNANFYNVMLNIDKNTMPSIVSIKDAKFFAESQTISPYAVNITETDNINIENSKFVDYEGGICVGLPWPISGKAAKATGTIKNNTISFDPNVIITKDGKALERVGIEINSANIDVEENEIEGGDIGIMMKNNSSGRISNNTVSFDVDTASKKGVSKTGIKLSTGSSSTEISGNIIINEDDSVATTSVVGIEINASKANMYYNSIGFENGTSGIIRTGIKVVSPTDTMNVYNNTIYNPLQAFNITQGASPKKIKMINNIYWSDNTIYSTINDTTKVSFYNNCFIDNSMITGTNNIFTDPEMNAPASNDFTIDSESPCVNAGMLIPEIHVFDAGKSVYYYGSAPDIGAKELYQELTSPPNVTTSVSGTNFTFSWNPVPGFFYEIYASDKPYSDFSSIGTTTNTSYTVPISSSKKFYYVIATTDPSKSGSIIQPEVTVTDKKTVTKPDEPLKKKIRINKSPKNN